MRNREDQDSLIPLADVPKLRWLPCRNGKRVHVSTVFRWADSGIGGIRLEFVQVGGVRCTTVAYLMDFFRRLRSGGRRARSGQATPRRTKQLQQIERALDEEGIG